METVFLYLRQTLGFMIQTIPCVWLCLMPIEERNLAICKKWCMLAFVAWFAVTGVGFACLIDTYREALTELNGHNYYMLGALLVAILLYCLFVKIGFHIKTLLLGIAVVYAAAIQIAANIIAAGMGHSNHHGEPYNEVFFTLFVILTILTYPLLLWGMGKRFRSFIYKRNLQMMKKYIVLLMFSNLAFLFLLTLLSSMVDGPSQYSYVLLGFFCGLVMLISLYWFVMEFAMQEVEYAEYQAQMNVLNLQFQKIQMEVSGVRRQNHDIRHHVGMLKKLLEEGECEKALAYLERDGREEAGKLTDTYCKEPLLNALLQYYGGIARKEKIACDIQVDLEACPIENRDMTILVGNCLENAITACCKVRSSERHLKLRIREVNATLAVAMENSCQEVRLSERNISARGFLPAEAFLSTKTGGGIGLRSIANIAEKYEGTAEFRYDGQTFYTRILLELG